MLLKLDAVQFHDFTEPGAHVIFMTRLLRLWVLVRVIAGAAEIIVKIKKTELYVMHIEWLMLKPRPLQSGTTKGISLPGCPLFDLFLC